MLDFVRDIYASFRQTSLERVKSPFLGAFVFSWLGFNWQMLSILFFSKKDIEQRLELINNSHDIGDYLLAPIFTTVLIVILLPQINKIINKIQDKPNSDIVELSLSSKIRIAELQQSLAESEARKKLADKKEERNIEEGIHNIKLMLQQTSQDLNDKNQEIQTLQASINDLHGRIAQADSKFNVEQESKLLLQKELTNEKDNNRTLSSKSLELTASVNKYKNELSSALEMHQLTLKSNNELKIKIDTMHVMMNSYVDSYPEIFDVRHIDGNSLLAIKSNAKKLLTNVNKTLKVRKESSRPEDFSEI